MMMENVCLWWKAKQKRNRDKQLSTRTLNNAIKKTLNPPSSAIIGNDIQCCRQFLKNHTLPSAQNF